MKVVKIVLIIAVVLGGVLLLVAARPRVGGAASPQELIETLIKANKTDETDLYLTLIRGSEDRANAKVMMDAAWAKRRFKEALIDARGDEAWEAFMAAKITASGGFAWSLKDVPPRDLAADQVIFDAERSLLAGPNIMAALEEHEGRWYVLFPLEFTSDEGREDFRATFNSLGQAYEDHIPLVGDMSISTEQFKSWIIKQGNPHITEWEE